MVGTVGSASTSIVPMHDRRAAQRLEPIERGEGIGRCGPRAGGYDLPRYGMRRFRRGVDQIFCGEVEFGDPWAFVKEPRGFVDGSISISTRLAPSSESLAKAAS